MKIHSVSLLAFLITVSGFFFSCNNIMNKNYGGLEVDSICLNETTHLFADTAKPACNLTIQLAYITKADRPALQDSLNDFFLSAALGDVYVHQAPAEAVKTYAQRYAEDYRKDLEPTYLQEKEEDKTEANTGSWYSYYRHLQSDVQFYEKELLVYRYRYEEYTGGAHGIYMTSFLNLNLQTLMPIRLDDLFVVDAQEALTDLLWNQLMADNHVTSREELEDLGYNSTGELAPTENFYLNKEGITFYYNVYEIAPYVMGPTQITLPWQMVQHLRRSEVEPILN